VKKVRLLVGLVPAKLQQMIRGALVRTPVRELFLRRRANRYLTVVAYHRIHPPVGPEYPFNAGVIEATPEEFTRQLRYLRSNLDLISMGELVAGLERPERLPARPGLITFDDGYRDNYDIALPLLREAGVPACFFLITRLVGTAEAPWPDQVACCLKFSRDTRIESPFASDDPPYDTRPIRVNGSVIRFLRNAKQVTYTRFQEILATLRETTGVNPDDYSDRPLLLSWDEVRKMKAIGMAIGGHTRTHPSLAGIEDPALLRDEVRGCREDIAQHTGTPPEVFAYPFGTQTTMSATAAAEVAHAGFRAAFSFVNTFAGRPPAGDRFCIPRLYGKCRDGFTGFRVALACGVRPTEARRDDPVFIA
jgi:peptidoglycan/xylan/chitin deacetylase (PgdA/CDA1 family)